MELQIAKMVIDTLAQGIHPVTGEAMPEDSPYNAAPVIRALHAVSRALEETQALPERVRTSRAAPPNSGKPWTAQEDAALETAFDAGIAIKDMARELGRTAHAVEQRLVRLGKCGGPSRGLSRADPAPAKPQRPLL